MRLSQFSFDLFVFLLLDFIIRNVILQDLSYVNMLMMIVGCSFTHCSFI